MSNRYVMLPHRRILRLAGADTRSFLQGLITQDVRSVSSTHSAWTALLTAQGKYVADFFLIAEGEQNLLLDCEATQATTLQKLFTLYKLRAAVTIEDTGEQYHVLAAMGDLTPLSLPEHAGRTEHYHDDRIIAYVDARHAQMAARIIAPAGEGETWLAQRGYAQASMADYEQHRLCLGIPRAGVDNIEQKTLILENGFEELHGVSFDKGCYVGQEVTARTKHRANLRKRLYQVQCENGILPPAGTEITLDGRPCGDMRSSCGTIGLAVLRDDAVEKSRVEAQPLVAGEVPITAKNPPWRT